MYLVSPTDRELLAAMRLKVSAMSHRLPEQYGADVLTAVEGRGKLAFQRKQFPDDFIASLEDGRITREVSLIKHAEYPVFLIEGWPSFTADGNLLASYISRWTKRQLRNVMRSLWYTQGIVFERTDNMSDTVDAILEFESWVRGEKHKSLVTRSKNPTRDSWGLANKRDMARFFLQGIPGIGSAIAEQIFDHFGRIPLKWDCSEDELRGVLGVGTKRAKSLIEMFQ